MKLPAFVPGPQAIAREALIVIGGALLAAVIISHTPSLKTYIKNAWK